jgi:hypothetical protein
MLLEAITRSRQDNTGRGSYYCETRYSTWECSVTLLLVHDPQHVGSMCSLPEQSGGGEGGLLSAVISPSYVCEDDKGQV